MDFSKQVLTLLSSFYNRRSNWPCSAWLHILTYIPVVHVNKGMVYRTACEPVARRKFLWHAAFTAVPICFFLPNQPVYIVNNIHTSHCVEIPYELPLLTNNTASEAFLHKSGEEVNAD